LRSAQAFAVRRSQIILMSAEGLSAMMIGERLMCSDQAVRNTIRAFEREGVACLTEKSHRPHTDRSAFSSETLAHLQDVLRHSPREYGYERTLWSLRMLAQVSHRLHLTAHELTLEGMRQVLKRLGLNWKQVRHHISSQDADYDLKKNNETV
jgi:transposase